MHLPTKKFQTVNEGFVCEYCRREIPPTQKGAPRDHCPFCLYSKHVDINPGDRANTCHGKLRPIGVTLERKRSYVIHYRCERCQQTTKCKAIVDDLKQNDDFEVLVKLSKKPVVNK